MYENSLITSIRKTVISIMTVLLLCSCGGGNEEAKESLEFDPDNIYEPPAMAEVSFDKDTAKLTDEVVFDLAHTSEGYFSVSVKSDKKLKMRVLFTDSEEHYDYDLDNDGTVCYYPLQMGSGSYSLIVYKNIEGTKYAALDYRNTDVTLADEFQPFIRPTYYIRYSSDSDCVRKAYELTRTASSVTQFIRNVYDFVCKTVRYDKKKAENLPSIYAPDPDETMNSGKGICFDYAALAAAMLRSQGVPCKLIMGNVSPNDLYHAWNMFYTEETGWITVKFEVSPNSWTRLDLTFSANGEDDEFIGNGENYTDMKEY
ncbi:MAG: transglutaminase domain-containing protein [Erysipelotrichaceae bacterium]|nr:transglutaminase domain-containing protein [Erysipelotrichaceae bacterium]